MSTNFDDCKMSKPRLNANVVIFLGFAVAVPVMLCVVNVTANGFPCFDYDAFLAGEMNVGLAILGFIGNLFLSIFGAIFTGIANFFGGLLALVF